MKMNRVRLEVEVGMHELVMHQEIHVPVLMDDEEDVGLTVNLGQKKM